VNGEIRPMDKVTVLARYDKIDYKLPNATDTKNLGDYTQLIYGVAYQYNKNVKFIASGKTVDAKEKTAAAAGTSTDPLATKGDLLDKQSWMLTTEVTW
jgi:predicted porin